MTLDELIAELTSLRVDGPAGQATVVVNCPFAEADCRTGKGLICLSSDANGKSQTLRIFGTIGV